MKETTGRATSVKTASASKPSLYDTLSIFTPWDNLSLSLNLSLPSPFLQTPRTVVRGEATTCPRLDCYHNPSLQHTHLFSSSQLLKIYEKSCASHYCFHLASWRSFVRVGWATELQGMCHSCAVWSQSGYELFVFVSSITVTELWVCSVHVSFVWPLFLCYMLSRASLLLEVPTGFKHQQSLPGSDGCQHWDHPFLWPEVTWEAQWLKQLFQACPTFYVNIPDPLGCQIIRQSVVLLPCIQPRLLLMKHNKAMPVGLV